MYLREFKRNVGYLLAALLLVWAAQILIGRASGEVTAPPIVSEKFVPADAAAAGGTLELRTEATVAGGDVMLRQICRWSDADKAVFAPISDLIVLRVGAASPFRSVSMEELKSILHDAGVNLAVIRFAGATACTVSRSDVRFDEREALNQWAVARQAATGESPESPATAPATGPANASVAADLPPVAATAPAAVSALGQNAKPEYRTLRDILLEDVAVRTKVAPELLQVDFAPKDQKLLTLMEPFFSFAVKPVRRGLGAISWDIAIVNEGQTRKVTVNATARAWQHQLVVTKPLAYKQILREEDFVERRTLVDQLPDSVLVGKSQAVGQMASQELQPGMVLTGRLVEAAPLVRPGQLVTITTRRGKVQITTVARAMEQGVYGQTIKVRNEATRDVMEVQVTGPQQGALSGPTLAGGDTN